MKYYNGSKLLSLKDINGEKPEIFMCCTNRTAGKTTFFSKLLLNRWFKQGKKFCIMTRYKVDLENVHEWFFKSVQSLFYPDVTFSSKTIPGIGIVQLLANDINCGYAVSLTSAGKVKKASNLLNDVDSMFIDEFQSEDGLYSRHEIQNFISLHISIARGNGEMSRYVPVYMCSNSYSLLNPYFAALRISHRIQSDTKFIRGDGWVLEQSVNLDAAEAQKKSPFNRAFSGSSYIGYAAENIYLNDSKTFIGKPAGKSQYLLTIRYENKDFGVRLFEKEGLVYCDKKPDLTFGLKVALDNVSHNDSTTLSASSLMWTSTLKSYYYQGLCRFYDLECKAAVMYACGLSYL